MMKSYLVDTIVKVDVTSDKFGVITETESVSIEARVEDYNKLITDEQGKEVMGDMIIFVETDTVFKFGDKIKIKTKSGITYEQPDKKFLIKKKIRTSGFSDSHWELYI